MVGWSNVSIRWRWERKRPVLELHRCQFHKIKYRGDLNNELVWYSNCKKCSFSWMVCYLDYDLNNGLKSLVIRPRMLKAPPLIPWTYIYQSSKIDFVGKPCRLCHAGYCLLQQLHHCIHSISIQYLKECKSLSSVKKQIRIYIKTLPI